MSKRGDTCPPLATQPLHRAPLPFLTGVGFPIGHRFQLDPGWDAQTDGYTFAVTDDDATFGADLDARDDGGGLANETGTDSGQSVVVTDPAGTTVASGRVHLEDGYTFVDEFGTTLTLYEVEVSGSLIGYIADGRSSRAIPTPSPTRSTRATLPAYKSPILICIAKPMTRTLPIVFRAPPMTSR